MVRTESQSCLLLTGIACGHGVLAHPIGCALSSRNSEQESETEFGKGVRRQKSGTDAVNRVHSGARPQTYVCQSGIRRTHQRVAKVRPEVGAKARAKVRAQSGNKLGRQNRGTKVGAKVGGANRVTKSGDQRGKPSKWDTQSSNKGKETSNCGGANRESKSVGRPGDNSTKSSDQTL